MKEELWIKRKIDIRIKRRNGKRSKELETRGKTGGNNISERPLKVELRKELGHWEGDTILFDNGKEFSKNLEILIEIYFTNPGSLL